MNDITNILFVYRISLPLAGTGPGMEEGHGHPAPLLYSPISPPDMVEEERIRLQLPLERLPNHLGQTHLGLVQMVWEGSKCGFVDPETEGRVFLEPGHLHCVYRLLRLSTSWESFRTTPTRLLRGAKILTLSRPMGNSHTLREGTSCRESIIRSSVNTP